MWFILNSMTRTSPTHHDQDVIVGHQRQISDKLRYIWSGYRISTRLDWCFGGMATVRHSTPPGRTAAIQSLTCLVWRGGIPDFMFDFGYISPPFYTSAPSFRPADFFAPLQFTAVFSTFSLQNGISFPLTIALFCHQTASKVALVPFRYKLMPYCLTMP